jgi:hypothetical protein
MSDPTQSMYIETQALYNCASSWRDEAAPKIATATQMAQNGEGQGYLFGAALTSLWDPHNTFATDAATVLATGEEVATEFGEALEQVAQDYENTDANIAELTTKTEADL